MNTEEPKCDCEHGLCKACGFCHNEFCAKNGNPPTNACWNTLKPFNFPVTEEKKTEHTKLEVYLGFSCDVCRGKKVSKSGDTLLHMCDGVLLPIVSQSTSSGEEKKEGWEEDYKRRFHVDYAEWGSDETTENAIDFIRNLLASKREKIAALKKEVNKEMLASFETAEGKAAVKIANLYYNTAIDDVLSILEE